LLFVLIVNTQQQYQSSESVDANQAASTAFQQTQIPTPHFVPTGFGDQQAKTSPFGAPPTFPGMPPLPNNNTQRFPTAFPPPTLPNTNTSSAFNANTAPPSAFNNTSAPPPSNAGQTSTFIGQQQQQPPPQQAGFYGQQQALFQPRPGPPTFGSNNNNNTNNAFSQQQQPPPSSSSPATINPSFIQPTGMPTPPPLASQQPYGGYVPQNNYYNPIQQYPK
jgi:hypothetical protein